MLELCLNRLRPTLSGHEVEVIVVDDNPDHPISRSILAPRWARVVRSRANLGYSGACNLGVEAARGDRIVFVDSDIVATKGWLDALLLAAAENPKAGAIGSKILDLSSGRIVAYGAAMHVVDTIHPYRGARADYRLTMTNRHFQLVPSGTMLIKRDIFRSIGGFDLVFRNAFCDFDLSMKLQQMGRGGIVSAGSLVYHRGAVSGAIRHAYYADTKSLFFHRWSSQLNAQGLNFLEDACRLLRAERSMATKPFLAINLSSSLSWSDYIDTAESALGIDVVQSYSFPAIERNASHIRLEDRLDWQTCRLKLPIIYFVDRFGALASNFYWFLHRPTSEDIVIDRNGNACRLQEMVTT